jgi:hypothetical protein
MPFPRHSVVVKQLLRRSRALEGRWAIQSEGKTLSIEMTYAAGSKGSIVMEQFGKELSVIYRDGESHDDPFLQRR